MHVIVKSAWKPAAWILTGFACGYLFQSIRGDGRGLLSGERGAGGTIAPTTGVPGQPEAGRRNDENNPDTRRWSRERAMAELDRLAGLPQWNNVRQRRRFEIFRDWMFVDPAAALACFKETTPYHEFAHYHPKLFASLFAHDREAALNYAVDLENNTDDSIDLGEILNESTKEDRSMLESVFKKFGDSDNAGIVAEALVQEMVEDDHPDVAWRWIEANTSGNMRNFAVNRYFTKLALVDPDEAYRRLAALPGSQMNDRLIPEIGRQMAKQDIHKALVWYQSLPQSSTKSETYSKILVEYIAKSPDQAASTVVQMPETELKSQLMSRLAVTMGTQDMDKAFKWIADQKWTPAVWGAYQALASHWSQRDPVASIAFWMENPDPKAKEALLNDAISPLIQKAFDQSLPLIQSMPPGVARDKGARLYARTAYANDPDQAVAWLDSLESGHFRDTAARGIVETSVSTNPERAVEVASQIVDNQMRLDLLKMSLTDIALRTPERAAKLLDGLAISAADKAEVLANIPNSDHDG